MTRNIDFFKKQTIKNPRPLQNMLVVAITNHVSGPIAASELAKQGATVFKVESISGDPARSYLHPSIFEQLNQGLLSVTMEPTLYENLLRLADVIIDNRSPNAKSNDKILNRTLKNSNKTLIYCSISGYGDQYNTPAMDVIVQATSGIAYTNAYNPSQPLKIGYVVADYNTGKTAATNIMSTWIGTKLHPEEYPSKLITLEITLTGELLNQQMGQVISLINTGKEAIRKGNQDFFLSPFSFYPTKDESYLAIAIATPQQFEKLCKMTGKLDWLEKYPTNKDRLTNPNFEIEFSKLIQSKTTDAWLTLFENTGLPVAKVNTLSEALKTKPVQSYLTRHKATGYPVVKSACKNSANPIDSTCFMRAPKLNEHYNVAIKIANQHSNTQVWKKSCL